MIEESMCRSGAHANWVATGARTFFEGMARTAARPNPPKNASALLARAESEAERTQTNLDAHLDECPKCSVAMESWGEYAVAPARVTDVTGWGTPDPDGRSPAERRLDLRCQDSPVGNDWQFDALCFQMRVDPDVMQPEEATRAEVDEAKALCVGCPVSKECRVHAEGQDGPYGVHAGEWFGDDPTWLVEQSCACCGRVRRVRERYAVGAWFCTVGCRTKGAVPA